MGFDTYIKELRKEKELSQTAFAKALGVSLTTIKNAEKGNTQKPNSKFLNALASYKKENKVVVYRDIIYYNDYPDVGNFTDRPFINFITLYSALRELESCEKESQYFDITFDDHAIILHYYIKNPSHLVLMFDANYFFYHNGKYDHNIEFELGRIVLEESINNRADFGEQINAKSVEIVFDAKNKEEVKIFNSLYKLNKINVFKKDIIIVLFDNEKLEVINKKTL